MSPVPASTGPAGTALARVGLGGAAAMLLLAGLGAVTAAGHGSVPPPARPAAVEQGVADPVRVLIPALGVDSPLARLGLDGAGVLVPPGTADVAGWFAQGPAPGGTGPALLAGHVDSRLGPGVFADLVELRPGDVVDVERADGSTAAFRVQDVEAVAKAAFPTAEVYGPAPGPELLLVTCGGEFDGTTHRDNVIVRAVPAPAGGWTFRD